MSYTSLWLRDWRSSEIVMPAAGDAVFLMLLGYAPPDQGQRTLDVFGVAFRSAGVAISVETPAGPVSVNAAPAGAGRFSARLQLPAAVVAAVVRARNTDPGATGEDRAAVAFRDAHLVELAPHQVHAVAAERLGYAAGAPDRLDYHRTFVKLDPVPAWYLLDGHAMFKSRSDKVIALDRAGLERALEPARDLRKAADAGEMNLRTYHRELRALIKRAAGEARRPADETVVEELRKRDEARKARRERLEARDKDGTPRRARDLRANSGPEDGGTARAATLPMQPGHLLDVELDDDTKLEEFIEEAEAFWRAHARLGVLFHERTRIRPTNQVFGEPIYQLALTPGEEVQIRQVSETKRRTSFSEITDLQSERETSFSSTWSTDMASTIASQQSFQQSTNIGTGLSGQVPEVPVSLSADVATSMANADSTSANDTVTTRRERTESATARMRQQHRVQIELAAEESQSLGTTRTLRNFNQQRAMLHTFFKVYRKEQVTVERYGAQLCLRLTVNDPARTTRAAFLANLNKIDPEVRAWKNIKPPAPEITDEFHFTITPTNDDGGPFHGTRVARAKSHQVDLRAKAGLGPEYVLTEPPRFVMTECEVEFYATPLHPTDPDSDFDSSLVPENQTSEMVPNVWVAWSFARNGGTIRWEIEPEVEAESAVAKLRAELPLFYTAPGIFGEREMEIAHVRFRAETKWGPSTQARADYLDRVHAEKLRLAEDFRAEHVTALHAIAEAGYPHAALDLALSESLAYPPEFEFHNINQIFDIEGAMIENVPYWADSATRDQHDALMLRLQRLPVQLELHEILTDSLTAAQAVVYLPVNPGMEERALKLLPEARKLAAEIAADIHQLRESRYGRLRSFAAPTVDQHMGPAPVVATPPGAADWTNDWERPQNRFDILGQWSELVPTDGVHVETHLSATVATDEHERNRLVRIVAGEG